MAPKWLICTRRRIEANARGAANIRRYACHELTCAKEVSPQVTESLPFADPCVRGKNRPGNGRLRTFPAGTPDGEQDPATAFFLPSGPISAQDLGSECRRLSHPRGASPLRTRVRHLAGYRLLYFAAVLSARLFELCT